MVLIVCMRIVSDASRSSSPLGCDLSKQFPLRSFVLTVRRRVAVSVNIIIPLLQIGGLGGGGGGWG